MLPKRRIVQITYEKRADMESAPTIFCGTNSRTVGDAGHYNAFIVAIAKFSDITTAPPSLSVTLTALPKRLPREKWRAIGTVGGYDCQTGRPDFL